MSSQANGTVPKGGSLANDLFADMGMQASRLSNTTATGTDEDTNSRVTEEIESLCMNCHADGTTRMLLTRIPFFREIVIMSFSCPECGFQNNEIQSAGSIQQKAAKYAFRVESDADLYRQVVKTDMCVFRIEDLDLEIPPGKGRYTNIEGLLSTVKADLDQHQDERLRQMPDVGAKVGAVIQTLSNMISGSRYPFMISVDDPSGNSWIEPKPADAAGKYAKSLYDRTPAQNAVLGLGDDVPQPPSSHSHSQENNPVQAPESDIRPEYHASNLTGATPLDPTPNSANVDADADLTENQVYAFPSTCPGCTRPCATNMKMVSIPYFKQVVLMSTVCQDCGYRSNEVKTGGAVPDKASRITLQVRTAEDLARDVLKSESAALSCPELQLRVEPGTMGGRFTTVEGILTQIRRDLRSQAFGLEDGDAPVPESDSMTSESKRTWEDFFASLEEAISGAKPFSLVLEDPLASSYVQSLTAPEPDPSITVEEYERTHEEEEDLGLNDIKVEGYEEDHARETAERQAAQ